MGKGGSKNFPTTEVRSTVIGQASQTLFPTSATWPLRRPSPASRTFLYCHAHAEPPSKAPFDELSNRRSVVHGGEGPSDGKRCI